MVERRLFQALVRFRCAPTRDARLSLAAGRIQPQSRSEARRALRRSEGQAIVEFVLVLPLIVTLIFVLIQFGVTFNDYLRVTDTARVAARAAAVARFKGETPCVAAGAVVSDAGGGLVLSQCLPGAAPGDPVQIKVTHPWTISLPLLPLSDSGSLESVATERLE